MEYPRSWKNRTGKRQTCHVMAAEKALGKPLPKGAQVHHIDGNKQNYRNDNLVILQNQKEHLSLHARRRVLRAGGNPWTQRICSSCKEVSDFANFCVGDLRCRECAATLVRMRTFDKSRRA